MSIQLLPFFQSLFILFISLIFFQIVCTNLYALTDKESFIANLQKESPAWMDEQIQRDFAPYRYGIDKKMLENIFLLNPSDMLLVRIKVLNNQLYFENSHDWTQRSWDIHKALLFLIESIGLPDLDVVMTTHDSISSYPMGGPILTFAKKYNSSDGILIPDCEALSDYRGQFSYEKLQEYPWKNKERKAFWRGSSSGGGYTKENWNLFPRAILTLLSIKKPHLLDAKFTGIVQCEPGVYEIFSQNHLIGDYTSVSDHLKYRYLIDVDGNTCTYPRCYWILLSNSLLLKQVSNDIQWFYGGLIPYKHYIPLKIDLTDTFEKIQWAKNNDVKAEKISKNATKFARESLSRDNIYKYFYLVLKEYARLQQLNEY